MPAPRLCRPPAAAVEEVGSPSCSDIGALSPPGSGDPRQTSAYLLDYIKFYFFLDF